MGETIRVRLTLWYVGFLAVLMLVFAGIVTAAELRNEAIALDQTLRAAALAAPEPPDDGDGERGVGAAGGAPAQDLLYVRVVTQNGAVTSIAGDARLARAVPLPRQWPARATLQTVRVPATGERIRVFRAALKDYGRTLRVEAAGVNRDYRELERLLGGIALAAPPTLGLAVLMGLFLAGRALRPMEAVIETARELSAGDLSRRIALRGPHDEIKRLADTFDAMLARLEAAFRSQQSFVADASHELRTPLTILQSHADLALSDPAAGMPEYSQALAVVRAESRRLSRVVAGLLTLARADAGSLAVNIEPVDLATLCEETLCRLHPLAGARALTYEGPPELLVRGDPDWLRQLLLNLVENAIQHTPADGEVRLSALRTGHQVRLEVRDNGCGIASEHLPYLFDRFYRVDKARSRSQGGAGLGLAIGRWITERHGGTIELTSQPGAGTTVTVTLPAAATDDVMM